MLARLDKPYPLSAEMSTVGRSNCRAGNAEIVSLIDENGKPGEYAVSMEFSKIIVDWSERSRSLFEVDR
jgi:hypothetical protein